MFQWGVSFVFDKHIIQNNMVRLQNHENMITSYK
jgi:hypothetical protein